MLYYKLCFSFNVRLCYCFVHMLHTKLYFGNCSHFSEREENGERLAVNKLSFPNNRSSYVRRLLTEYLTKDTAVSQKCQQNVSKIAQRHEYKLPSAAMTLGAVNPRDWSVWVSLTFHTSGCGIIR